LLLPLHGLAAPNKNNTPPAPKCRSEKAKHEPGTPLPPGPGQQRPVKLYCFYVRKYVACSNESFEIVNMYYKCYFM
jgi:hypothetical protein